MQYLLAARLFSASSLVLYCSPGQKRSSYETVTNRHIPRKTSESESAHQIVGAQFPVSSSRTRFVLSRSCLAFVACLRYCTWFSARKNQHLPPFSVLAVCFVRVIEYKCYDSRSLGTPYPVSLPTWNPSWFGTTLQQWKQRNFCVAPAFLTSSIWVPKRTV